MLISTKGRYAVRVLIDLAEHVDDGYIPLKVVAARQEVSEKYLESILKVLVKHGILRGLRGKGGGYRLGVDPKECTLDRVLRLTEETLAPVSCLEDVYQPPCPRAQTCKTLPVWRGLGEVIDNYLKGITLEDLVNGTAGKK